MLTAEQLRRYEEILMSEQPQPLAQQWAQEEPPTPPLADPRPAPLVAHALPGGSGRLWGSGGDPGGVGDTSQHLAEYRTGVLRDHAYDAAHAHGQRPHRAAVGGASAATGHPLDIRSWPAAEVIELDEVSADNGTSGAAGTLPLPALSNTGHTHYAQHAAAPMPASPQHVTVHYPQHHSDRDRDRFFRRPPQPTSAAVPPSPPPREPPRAAAAAPWWAGGNPAPAAAGAGVGTSTALHAHGPGGHGCTADVSPASLSTAASTMAGHVKGAEERAAPRRPQHPHRARAAQLPQAPKVPDALPSPEQSAVPQWAGGVRVRGPASPADTEPAVGGPHGVRSSPQAPRHSLSAAQRPGAALQGGEIRLLETVLDEIERLGEELYAPLPAVAGGSAGDAVVAAVNAYRESKRAGRPADGSVVSSATAAGGRADTGTARPPHREASPSWTAAGPILTRSPTPPATPPSVTKKTFCTAPQPPPAHAHADAAAPVRDPPSMVDVPVTPARDAIQQVIDGMHAISPIAAVALDAPATPPAAATPERDSIATPAAVRAANLEVVGPLITCPSCAHQWRHSGLRYNVASYVGPSTPPATSPLRSPQPSVGGGARSASVGRAVAVPPPAGGSPVAVITERPTGGFDVIPLHERSVAAFGISLNSPAARLTHAAGAATAQHPPAGFPSTPLPHAAPPPRKQLSPHLMSPPADAGYPSGLASHVHTGEDNFPIEPMPPTHYDDRNDSAMSGMSATAAAPPLPLPDLSRQLPVGEMFIAMRGVEGGGKHTTATAAANVHGDHNRHTADNRAAHDNHDDDDGVTAGSPPKVSSVFLTPPPAAAMAAAGNVSTTTIDTTDARAHGDAHAHAHAEVDAVDAGAPVEELPPPRTAQAAHARARAYRAAPERMLRGGGGGGETQAAAPRQARGSPEQREAEDADVDGSAPAAATAAGGAQDLEAGAEPPAAEAMGGGARAGGDTAAVERDNACGRDDYDHNPGGLTTEELVSSLIARYEREGCDAGGDAGDECPASGGGSGGDVPAAPASAAANGGSDVTAIMSFLTRAAVVSRDPSEGDTTEPAASPHADNHPGAAAAPPPPHAATTAADAHDAADATAPTSDTCDRTVPMGPPRDAVEVKAVAEQQRPPAPMVRRTSSSRAVAL